MKKLHSFLFIITFTFSFLSYAQEPTQMQKVVNSHNDVMTKMPVMVKLINKLQPKVNSTETGKKYQIAINDLKASNKSMATWMQDFGKRFTADEMMKGKALTDKKKTMLNEDEKKLNVLSAEINSSIKKAEKLLHI